MQTIQTFPPLPDINYGEPIDKLEASSLKQ